MITKVKELASIAPILDEFSRLILGKAKKDISIHVSPLFKVMNIPCNETLFPTKFGIVINISGASTLAHIRPRRRIERGECFAYIENGELNLWIQEWVGLTGEEQLLSIQETR